MGYLYRIPLYTYVSHYWTRTPPCKIRHTHTRCVSDMEELSI